MLKQHEQHGSQIMSRQIVVGHFGQVAMAQAAISRAREEGFKQLEVFSPFPSHELDEELYRGQRRSPVRMFTLVGGLLGLTGAFLMTIWMSRDWPLRTSAKPIVSIPAFVVIGFECTVLLGAICTLLGMFLNSGLPKFTLTPGYRGCFSEGTFGVGIYVDDQEVDGAVRTLQEKGATKVEVSYVRG